MFKPGSRRETARRSATAITIAAMLGFTLSACGESGHDAASDTETAVNGDVFNHADVDFATQMIPHHAQAVQMVAAAQDRQLDPEVRQLANGVRDTQVPEVETMVRLLTAWGKEVPETPLDHANAGHDMSGDSGDVEHGDDGGVPVDDMPGMMSSEEMKALSEASDAEFQVMWLQMMIEHHLGAIEMAKLEQQQGAFKPALKLAKSIKAAQEREVATMEELMG